MGIRRNADMDLPSLESLPKTVCGTCNRSLINGLFLPAELASTSPHCRTCAGEINSRKKWWNGGNEPLPRKGKTP